MSKRCYDDGDEMVSHSDVLSQMREQIQEVLGEQKSAMYFKCLKDWIRGRKQQDEFDSFGLALMPSDRTDLHTQFILAILDHCELSLDSSNDERKSAFAKKTAVKSVMSSEHLSDESSSTAEFTEQKKNKVFDELCEVSDSQYGWLPHKGQVRGRLLLAAWESGFGKVSEETIDLIVSTTKIMMMNLLEACVRLKRNHLVTETGATYSYGILNRRNARSSNHVIIPNSEPINARDLLDAIRIDQGLVNNPKLRNSLITRLKAAEAEES